MMQRLNYCWRILATGFCFSTFFVMGVTFRVAVCPVMNLLIRDKEVRVRRARKVVNRSFSFFTHLMRFVGVLDWELHGVERLNQPGTLVCSSHPTLIDVVFLMSFIENANCIVKSALTHSFALSSPVITSGYISNDSGPELIDACAESLDKGDTLVIFPEGTRSRPGIEPKLHHGAAAAALLAKKDIVPVRITCNPPSLMKGIPWYVIPQRKMHFTIEVGDPVDIRPFVAMEAAEGRPIAVRRLTNTLKTTLFPIKD